MLTLIDAISHEYQAWSPTDVRRVPLAQLLTLYSAIAARNDMKPKGPTYLEQELLKILKEERPEG